MSSSKRSSAWTRGAPYVPRLAVWISLILAERAASAADLVDGGRFDHAQYPLG
jgi:hypothetical protein